MTDLPTLEERLTRVDALLNDGWADLETRMAGYKDAMRVRLWQGDVLVDWEADDQAGGCLVRPYLIRRLAVLHARVRPGPADLLVEAPRTLVSALSPRHGHLVNSLGPVPDLVLRLHLRFDRTNGRYLGGDEAYLVPASITPLPGQPETVLLRLRALVHPGPLPGTLKRTLPAR